jgi:hypothetical protein
MGFVIVVVGTVYLLISVGVVAWAVSHAKKAGKNAKKWGWGAVLVMWLIPFWDWIPTVVVHQYYCATESGFWVYKTLDQWKKENPGVMETLSNIPPEQFLTGVTGLHDSKQYLLPDGTRLIADFDVKGQLMWANFKAKDGSQGYWLNQRFNWVTRQEPYFPLNHMIREEQTVVDSKTGEVLVRYVDFSASQEPRQAGLTGWKFWLDSPHCSNGDDNESLMRQFKNSSKGAEK